MIAIIDYDAGNTFNVQKALQHIGLDAVLTADRDTILAADGVILPGVGAYASAVSVLRERGHSRGGRPQYTFIRYLSWYAALI